MLKPFEVQSAQLAPYLRELGLGQQYELATSVSSLLRSGIIGGGIVTLHELAGELRMLPIPEDAYELNGQVRDECYVLEGSGSTWSVFYTERGLRSDIRTFNSEEAACDYFLRCIKRDFAP